MANRPAPEVVVDEALVRELLHEQHPDLAQESITLLARGWDNTNFRLGSQLIVRLPHRQVAADLVETEQRWLSELAPRLNIEIPAPVRLGKPSGRYPWPWSITPWFEGDVAARCSLADPAAQAKRLGEFFGALHVPGPDNAPINPYRGGPLADRAEAFAGRVAALGADFDPGALRAVFDRGLAAPLGRERCWLHGDLHTRNIIVDEGRIAAIIDWGDLCVGDPACDLAGAFMLVPDHIDVVAEHAGATDAAWERARGWAVHFGVLYVVHGDDDAVMSAIGSELLAALLNG